MQNKCIVMSTSSPLHSWWKVAEEYCNGGSLYLVPCDTKGQERVRSGEPIKRIEVEANEDYLDEENVVRIYIGDLCHTVKMSNVDLQILSVNEGLLYVKESTVTTVPNNDLSFIVLPKWWDDAIAILNNQGLYINKVDDSEFAKVKSFCIKRTSPLFTKNTIIISTYEHCFTVLEENVIFGEVPAYKHKAFLFIKRFESKRNII